MQFTARPGGHAAPAPACRGCSGSTTRPPTSWTANTIGLPRYAEQAVDQQFARWVMLHVQSIPLPICTRSPVLIKDKRT